MNLKDVIQSTKCFVLDMDGTIYLGDRLFDFTINFLDEVQKSGRDFVFFTNNSSKNAAFYIKKLKKMGIEIEPAKMLISNQVIIKYLQQNHAGKSVYVVGTEYLIQDFIDAEIEVKADDTADIGILGFDITLTYEKLCIICDIARAGKPVYGVNMDYNCPTDGGFIPDCGAMATLIHASTGVMPEFFGKPSPHTLKHVIDESGFAENEITFVGDRLYTDIATTMNSNAKSILVLSGESQLVDIPASEAKPDAIAKNLAEMTEILRSL